MFVNTHHFNNTKIQEFHHVDNNENANLPVAQSIHV